MAGSVLIVVASAGLASVTTAGCFVVYWQTSTRRAIVEPSVYVRTKTGQVGSGMFSQLIFIKRNVDWHSSSREPVVDVAWNLGPEVATDYEEERN